MCGGWLFWLLCLMEAFWLLYALVPLLRWWLA